MHRLTTRLLIYRNTRQDSFLRQLSDICRQLASGEYNRETLVDNIYAQIHWLLEFSAVYGLGDNLWHNYLAYLLVTDENPFSLACERAWPENSSAAILAKKDFLIFKQLFDYDFGVLESALQIDCFSIISHYQPAEASPNAGHRAISRKIAAFSATLADARDEEAIFGLVTAFYRQYGVGSFSLNSVFRINNSPNGVQLVPISNSSAVSLDDLIGYEAQKKRLVDNTEAFVQGKRANNLLLYGDSGTGKSTCVRAIQSMYQDRGLRVIELYKHQLEDLSPLITLIRDRRYRFILFLDDLSFDDFEVEFKHLKAVIEGGLEPTPDNTLIYATSNRRHLVKETWTDRNEAAREDDIHHSDTAEEKISLFNRFGETIRFFKPSTQEYLAIVKELAKRYPEIQISEAELLEKANKWGIWHGNISGRRAQQFINYLAGQS